jgi:hypothetical protein
LRSVAVGGRRKPASEDHGGTDNTRRGSRERSSRSGGRRRRMAPHQRGRRVGLHSRRAIVALRGFGAAIWPDGNRRMQPLFVGATKRGGNRLRRLAQGPVRQSGQNVHQVINYGQLGGAPNWYDVTFRACQEALSA